jgi:hypothetical protein
MSYESVRNNRNIQIQIFIISYFDHIISLLTIVYMYEAKPMIYGVNIIFYFTEKEEK